MRPDFVLNIWNFCTMTTSDLFTHVFRIYDDDQNGTLDAAECDSLFRLLYHTDELSQDIKKVVADVDANGDGLLSLDEFSLLCSRNKALMNPVILLQAKAQEKCLGAAFWTKESKKRLTLMAGHKDIFSLVQKKSEHPREPVEVKKRFDPVVDKEAVPPPALRPKASERLAAKQKLQELKALEKWIEEQRQQPAIDNYFVTFSDKFVSDSRLKRLLEVTRPSADDVKITTELRYSTAVCAKKFETAKATVRAIWEAEQQSMTERRHEAVKGMVNGVSAKTLLKQTSKQSAGSAIGSYLQKKLDEAEQDVRRQVQERWEMLERAAKHIASQDLAAFDEVQNRQPMGSLFQKDESDHCHSMTSTFGLERTKIVPINTESWTEYYDEAHARYYYVSSLGYSTWDRPESFVVQ